MLSNPTPLATKTAPKCVVLVIPSDAWNTLNETLEVDSESSAFDPVLRHAIKAALTQVQPITAQVSALLDVAEEVPRCAFIRGGDLRYHVIGDERIERLKQALRFFRSHFEILGGRRQYRKQLV